MKKLTALLAAITLTTSLTACSDQTELKETPEAREDAVAALSTLNSAASINLKKDVFSFGDHWTVIADSASVATIEGRFLKFGEVYSLLSPKGGLMAGEDENIFSVSRTANFYNNKQEVVGEVRKDILSLTASYRLKDSAGRETVKLDQNFAFGFKGEVKDGIGNSCWKFSKELLSVGASISLERVGDAKCVKAETAVLLVALANEVSEAESKSK